MSEGTIEVDLVLTGAEFSLESSPVLVELVDPVVQVLLEQPEVPEIVLQSTDTTFALESTPVLVELVAPPTQIVLEPPSTSEIVLATLGEQGPPGPAGTAKAVRRTTDLTSSSLAPGASQQTSVTLSPSVQVYRVSTTKPCRVRLYTTAAKQAADLGRPINIDPVGDHGVALELVFASGVLSIDLSPVVTVVDLKDTPDGVVPVTVTNIDSTSGSVTLSFTYTEVE